MVLFDIVLILVIFKFLLMVSYISLNVALEPNVLCRSTCPILMYPRPVWDPPSYIRLTSAMPVLLHFLFLEIIILFRYCLSPFYVKLSRVKFLVIDLRTQCICHLGCVFIPVNLIQGFALPVTPVQVDSAKLSSVSVLLEQFKIVFLQFVSWVRLGMLLSAMV